MVIDRKTLYLHIGTALRKQREALKLTQNQLAGAAGVLRSSIANIESGKQQAPLHVLYSLAGALRLEIKNILPPVQTVVSDKKNPTKEVPKILNPFDDLGKKTKKAIQEVIKNK